MRHNLSLLFVGNALLGAQMPMLIVLGGLVGAFLAPSPALATLTVSIQMLAVLLAVAPISLLMGRLGRRAGFLLGAACAMVGGVFGTLALLHGLFWLICIAHGLFGVAQSSFGFFRFAAADAAHDHWKPRAISLVIGSGLIAALLGPEILIHAKDYFAPIPFAGGYAAITLLCLIGGVPIAFLSLPAPPRDSGSRTKKPLGHILSRPPVAAAIVSATATHALMVLMMTPTPLAMSVCGFSTDQSSDVIRWHVIAMFGPSFFTGPIIARLGAVRVIAIGLMLLTGCAAVAWAGILLENFYIALLLLGIGWNFGFIGSTSLLSQHVPPVEQSVVQGLNDTVVALAATVASFSAGALITSFGWASVILATLPLIVAPAFCLAVVLRQEPRALDGRP